VPSAPDAGAPDDERELFQIAAKLPCQRRGALLISAVIQPVRRYAGTPDVVEPYRFICTQSSPFNSPHCCSEGNSNSD
jgi:hypothetical protein